MQSVRRFASGRLVRFVGRPMSPLDDPSNTARFAGRFGHIQLLAVHDFEVALDLQGFATSREQRRA